ncbi:MAG: rhomboid family intramembrane serine protease [Crocinitomicaceae bacterium]|nr:rhomboid family intramembrane serine protease [Crocinitomicaceae bacterium]
MYITYLLLVVTIIVSVKAFNDNEFKWKLIWNPYNAVHHKQWYRSFTHAFIHADWMHLGFNMFVLYGFGIGLEEMLQQRFGPKGYLFFGCLYLGGILFSNILSLNKHKDNPHYNSLGASGAVMAVLFAYVLMNPNAGLMFIFFPVPIPAYIMGPLILVAEYYMSRRGGSRIAHDAHFAGAIFGIVFMTIVDYKLVLEFVSKIGS